MKDRQKTINADFVIAGGGIAAVCGAIYAARLGLKTVLINNRPYFGGNASAELMINLCGATGTQEFNYNARETGIIEELILENMYRNPHANRWVWDSVVADKLMSEKNIVLFPNTCIDEVVLDDDNKIEYIAGTQSTTETRFVFRAPIFADNTGDGTVAYLSGAEFKYGREASAEYGERLAPAEADNGVLPSTMVFTSTRFDCPVPFKAPSFATSIPESGVLEYRVIPEDNFANFKWFYEIDGKLDQVFESETITEHHRALVFGIWDYIKNSGKYPSENHDLTYVSPVPGKRESRRIVGDYILCENDLVQQTDFDDCIGYGGWSIDLHAIDGFYSKEPINRHVLLRGIYQIPFRCGYSKDIGNLFIQGRCMSISHIAHGSVRVMSTLATVGQANAAAAFLCRKYCCTPRDIYTSHINELQNILLKADQFIIGKEYVDKENLAENAEITVSSEKMMKQTEGECIIKLGFGLGFSFPVKERFDGIRFFAKSKKRETVKYEIYKSEKPENYCPEILLVAGEASLCGNGGFETLSLKADIKDERGYLFIKLSGDSEIEFKAAPERWTGVETSYLARADADNYVDIETLERRSFMYRQCNGILCFEPIYAESLFGADALENGYARPFSLPNVWHSQSVENEFVNLKWKSKTSLSKLTLIFDSYLNEYVKNGTPRECNVRRSIVRDYDIEARAADGDFQKIKEIRGNYQRINCIEFDAVETDEVRVRFLATNGQPFISLFSVRAYK